MRTCREALLSCWCHDTCLNIDFYGIDRGGESHGGGDRRFVMAERCIACKEDVRHIFFTCIGCLVTCNNGLEKMGW
jgi:hypothetical protein